MSTITTTDRSDQIESIVDELDEILVDPATLTEADRENLTKIRKRLGHALNAATPALDLAAPARGSLAGLSSSDRSVLMEIDAARNWVNPAAGDARLKPWVVKPRDTGNGIVAKAKLDQHDAAGHWQFTSVLTIFAGRKRHLAHGMRRMNRGLLFVPDARTEDAA